MFILFYGEAEVVPVIKRVQTKNFQIIKKKMIRIYFNLQLFMFLNDFFVEFDGIEIHSKLTFNEPNKKDVEDENERGGELTGPTVCLHIINRIGSLMVSGARLTYG